VNAINEKTKSFSGMQVPVKVIVDTSTKAFEIEIGTPPTSQLLKKETGILKGAGNPKTDKVADLKIEQVIKIALMKETTLLGNNLHAKIKQIIGTCNSMGILIEGVSAKEAVILVNEGKFDKKIKERKTELSAEELKELEEEKKRLQAEIEKHKVELTARAKEIIAQMAGKPRGSIKERLLEEGVPGTIIDELLPIEDAAAEGADKGKPAAVAAAAPKKEK